MKHFKRYSPLIIIIFVISAVLSCTKEAPTVNLGDYIGDQDPGVNPGYFYPFVSAVYPADGSTDVPVNTKFVIVFNMPVDADDFDDEITATGGGAYTITPASGASNSAIITFSSQLPAGAGVTVSVGPGIHELVSGTDEGIILTAGEGYSWTFTAGSEPDVTQPVADTGSRIPVDNAIDVALNSTVQLSFTELGEIDITSANSNTFYIEDSSFTRIACTYSYTAATNTVTLTPASNLEANETYTVTATTGVKDLSGNSISAGDTWDFDTIIVVDPMTGNPTIATQPAVSFVSTTRADISWETNESTTCTLSYGLGDNVTSTATDGILSTYHSLSLALSPGERYFAQLLAANYIDFSGLTGIANSTLLEFNTETNDPLLDILDDEPENQLNLNYITYNPAAGNTGAFAFWLEQSGSNYYLYGQLYDSTFSGLWNGGNRTALFNGSTTAYLSSAEDGLGGVIVLTTPGASGIRAKRISNSGALSDATFDWGATANTVAGLGLSIGAGTDATAAPVYSGIFTAVANGTTEMSNLPNTNVFYDFNPTIGADFSAVENGDIVIDATNGDMSTVTVPYSNFLLHSLYQVTDAVNSGNNYRIIDVDDAANYDTGTANYLLSASTQYVYASTHAGSPFTPPGWLTYTNIFPAGYSTADIMEVNGVLAYITGYNASYTTTVTSGTSDDTTPADTNVLYDPSAPFGNVNVGDTVWNTTDSTSTAVSGVVSNSQLTLNDARFNPSGGENYRVETSTLVSSSSSDAGGITDNHLTDASALWVTGLDPVYQYDRVVNTTTPGTALVQTVLSDTDLLLYGDIFNLATPENYSIYETDVGTSSAVYTNILYDDTANFGTGSGPVFVGDTVTNTSLGGTALVTVVTNNQLTLDDNIFDPAGGENYSVTGTFFRFTLSTPVNTSADPNFIIYNNNAIVAGQADTPPENPPTVYYPLYDNEGGLGSVEIGDIVLNWTDGTWTTVNNITYRAYGALGLTSGIMADNEVYRIVTAADDGTFTAANITDIGDAVLGGGSTLRTDGGATVYPGDVVYNLTDNDYGIVTSVSSFDLTLSKSALFNAGDDYVILRGRVLYAWQNGTVVNASIRSLSSGVPLTSFSPLISDAQNPRTVPDGRGNTYLVYEDTSGAVQEIRIRLLNAAGEDVWTPTPAPEVSDQSTYNETIIKVISDDSAGVIILYQYSNGTYQRLRAKRINSSGTAADLSMWGVNGYDIGNIATVDSINAVDMAYNGANDVLVAAQIGNNIWARRVGVTSWAAGVDVSNPAGIQQNPKIFISDWTVAGYATVVWEDDRFTSTAGYGIFGMQLVSTDGIKRTTWRVNTNTADYNGASVVLNSGNKYWPNIQIVSYNNGTNAALVWEDRRNIFTLPYKGSDLLYIDIDSFTPY